MEKRTFRNINFATIAGLHDVLDHGSVLRVRNDEVTEIQNRVTIISRPKERCLFLRHRGNNIFATVAEALWVLAGRNDVAWLQHYLPRAGDFSDDGRTWRGAYGPRLRDWNGVDQLSEIRQLLLRERLTRRAVMVLYDPDRDFTESKDIPCNNWLHWIVRDGQLHLNVAVRSNDVIWGFSGVNSYEWSVLQEMMAYWIGVPVGRVTYFASSFHLYRRHYEMAKKMTADFDGVTCYDFGIQSPPFQTSWSGLDQALAEWFKLEGEVRASPERPVCMPPNSADPLFDGALQLLRLCNGEKHGWPGRQLQEQLWSLPETDLTVAAYEFLGRKYPEVLDSIPQPLVASFFQSYRNQLQSQPDAPSTMLRSVIKSVHQRKSESYGDAWKRRGELNSILPNIARKIDRLDIFASRGTLMADESILETAIDLYVYLTKYRLFLMEALPYGGEGILPADTSRPFSDHIKNFDAVVDQVPFQRLESSSLSKQVDELSGLFEDLQSLATDPESVVQKRLEGVIELSDGSIALMLAISQAEPGILRRLWARERELRE